MSDAPPVLYLVRFSPQAAQDADEAAVRLEELTGETEAAKLNLFPRAHPLAEGASRLLGQEVRRLIYRRPGSKVGHRIHYTVSEGDDGPLVKIVHIRHGARQDITAAEAKDILRNQ